MVDYNIIDTDVLKYYVDNNCSSGPLQSSFEILLQDMTRDYQILQTGMAFVIIGLIFHVVSGLWATKLEIRHMFCCCFDKKDAKVVFEMVKDANLKVLPFQMINKIGIARARQLANRPQRDSQSQGSDSQNYDMGKTMEINAKETSKGSASKHPYTQIADESQKTEIIKHDI